MSIQPESLETDVNSPLRGFNFTRDWLAEEEFPRRFLGGTGSVLEDRLAALAAGTWCPWTADEVSDLQQFNMAAGNNAGAGLAESLAREDALVVVTGQQPDFLASPLYVLHKALSASAWARRMSAELSRPVVPVFWVASDDDDFTELKKAWLVSFAGELIDAGGRINRGRGLNSGTPAYRWNLTESASRAKQDIRRALKDWPGGDETSHWLEQVIDKHPNFEMQFCHLLAELLGGNSPMLFVAPRLKAFRHRQVEVLVSDVRKHAEVNRSLSEAAEEFSKAGYPVTLQREADALNFFWLHENSRHRLIRDSDQIIAIDPHTHVESARFSEAELLKQIEAAPESFAPNVVTRPVVQDTALPTAAYVAGPGELAYLAVLGAAYREHRCIRSAVIPRTLVTMDPQGVLREWTGGKPPEKLADAVLSRGGSASEILLDQIKDLMADTAENIERMRATATCARPEVKLALDKSERHFLHGVEQLKRRVARQVAPEQWNHAARLSAIMSPAGGAQERTLAPWNFVKAGEWAALADHLLAHADYTSTQPQTAPVPSWMKEAL